MKFIEDINLTNKKVILRLDLNVTIKDNIILDNKKIIECLPTINYLLNNNCHILIMSHLGKIKSEEDKAKNSLLIVSYELEKLLNKKVNFVSDTRGLLLEKSFNENEITLMENTRYEDYPEKLESNCDNELSSYWASLGDIFINDAFGTTHRKHASNYGITKYIESGYGYLIKNELIGLDPIINNVQRPFTVIMGGAKVDDKIALINEIIKECDYLIVGGGIANTFIKALGYNVGLSLYSKDYIDEISSIINEYKEKIIIPELFIVENNGVINIKSIKDIENNDIIYDNKVTYQDILKKSKTVFLNGTIGLYEKEFYQNGTKELFNTLKECNSIKIAGGGDALASINYFNQSNIFNYMSTGGGATLDYIAYKKLKCFEVEK